MTPRGDLPSRPPATEAPDRRPASELPVLAAAAGVAPPRREHADAAGGAPRRERADAARNRERVLAAARRLFADRGVRAVTMSDVAREAGVAKGTVFHRFGDRAGLALALVDEQERTLQERILRGSPPLGPGAPSRERLLAFLAALAALTVENRELLLE